MAWHRVNLIPAKGRRRADDKNVEIVATVAQIVRHGAEWFRTIGTEKSPGPKIFSVCGHVARPGCYEVFAMTGVNFRKRTWKYC